MPDISLNPVVPVVGGALVGSTNPLPVKVIGGTGVPLILGAGGGIDAPGDTNENILASVTIPANAMGTKGRLRISSSWNYTNSANNKIMRNRFSGIGGTIYGTLTATTTASVSDRREIGNLTAGTQSGYNGGIGTVGTSTSAAQTSSVDTTQATTLVFTAQKASAGETITLVSYIVELIPAVP